LTVSLKSHEISSHIYAFQSTYNPFPFQDAYRCISESWVKRTATQTNSWKMILALGWQAWFTRAIRIERRLSDLRCHLQEKHCCEMFHPKRTLLVDWSCRSLIPVARNILLRQLISLKLNMTKSGRFFAFTDWCWSSIVVSTMTL